MFSFALVNYFFPRTNGKTFFFKENFSRQGERDYITGILLFFGQNCGKIMTE